MPSIFSRGQQSQRPMFTQDDIRKLIQTFPPPEPRSGKESLVRSLSGTHLVRSDAVVRRFNALLRDAATGFVYLNRLNSDLGVHDVRWMLAKEDARIFFTRDRTRLLGDGAQKQVLGRLRSALEKGGVKLEDVAADNDVTVATLLRVVTAQDATLALEELEDGHTYSVAFLEKTERELMDALRDATSAVVLGDRFPQVPLAWLETVAPEIVAGHRDSVRGVVDQGPPGLRFTPHSTLEQQASEFKRARDAYIRNAVDDLISTGYCNISPGFRPDTLREGPETKTEDFSRAILEAFKQAGAEESIVELEANDQDGEHMFLLRQDTLSSKTAELSQLAQQTAAKLWASRTAGEDMPFDSATVDLLRSLTPDPQLALSILSPPLFSAPVQAAYTSHLRHLSQASQSEFNSTLQTQLLAPLALYTLGLSATTDPALLPRLQEFIHTLFRTDTIPSVHANLTARNLLPTSRTAARDHERFLDAARASKNLDDLVACVAKLARKLKLDAPGPQTLGEVKLRTLEAILGRMERARRASDLLQNLVWVVLAGAAPGLFASAGKDTSRMVRLCRGLVDRDFGAWIEGLRLRVKEGVDTEEDRERMKREAERVVEALKREAEKVVEALKNGDASPDDRKAGEGDEVVATGEETDEVNGE